MGLRAALTRLHFVLPPSPARRAREREGAPGSPPREAHRLRSFRADHRPDRAMGGAVVAEPVSAAGRIEHEVTRAELELDALATLLPADGQAPFEHQEGILDIAHIRLHADADRDAEHLLAAGVRLHTALPHIDLAGEAGLVPEGRLLAVAHHIFRHLLLQRMRARLVEGNSLAWLGAEAARELGRRVLRVVEIARRQGLADIDADRHQHRLDAVIAEAMADIAGVEDHVFRAEPHLDHLAVALPTDSQHAVDDEEALLDLMRMAGRIFADRLMDEAHCEMLRLQGRGVADLGRAASADIAHLGPGKIRKAAIAREG